MQSLQYIMVNHLGRNTNGKPSHLFHLESDQPIRKYKVSKKSLSGLSCFEYSFEILSLYFSGKEYIP